MTIREKISYLEALCETLEYVNQQIEYAMDIKVDDDGNGLTDDEGKYIRIAPKKNDYNYNRYSGYMALKSQIEKLADKA